MNSADIDVMVRPINRLLNVEFGQVAQRMRATLQEVLGQARGRSMYPIDWLVNRVRQHQNGDLKGEVMVAEDALGEIVGHTIVRLDKGRNGETIGLFSTKQLSTADFAS